MPIITRPDDDEWDDDDEGYEDYDDDDDSETELTLCPKCGEKIYVESERCPECGEYITRVHPVWEGRPMWWKLVGLAGIIAMLASLAFFF
jgi:hypothetical protein